MSNRRAVERIGKELGRPATRREVTVRIDRGQFRACCADPEASVRSPSVVDALYVLKRRVSRELQGSQLGLDVTLHLPPGLCRKVQLAQQQARQLAGTVREIAGGPVGPDDLPDAHACLALVLPVAPEEVDRILNERGAQARPGREALLGFLLRDDFTIAGEARQQQPVTGQGPTDGQ